MLISVVVILLVGFFAGQIARRLGAPPLIGMILAGFVIGPQFIDLISDTVLESAGIVRTVAIMIILMKAGLGLDREKLKQQGTVALRLGFLPAIIEALVIAIAAMWIFQFDFLTSLLLGFMLGAESPAVIVPGMLRLKSIGLGVKKGITDAILSGSALSDVVMLLGFNLLIGMLVLGRIESLELFGLSLPPVLWIPLQLALQIVAGLIIGYLVAKFVVLLLSRQQWSTSNIHDGMVAGSLAILLVLLSEQSPFFSGYLAVMALGFFLIEVDAPLARYLRFEFDRYWTIAEIFLFVLLGATIDLQILGGILLPGLLLLSIGLLVGRMIGWYLSTLGSNWSWRERLFLLPANMPKATVQAAIGGMPLAMGLEGGEIFLAVAALSILVTAPVGAWGTVLLAPKLLEKGSVDATKVTAMKVPVILAAVNTSPIAKDVLLKAAELARRNRAKVIVLHVDNKGKRREIEDLSQQVTEHLADIRYDFQVINGSIPGEIVRVSEEYQVSEIVIGRRGRQRVRNVLLGSVSEAVIETSTIPVVLVEKA